MTVKHQNLKKRSFYELFSISYIFLKYIHFGYKYTSNVICLGKPTVLNEPTVQIYNIGPDTKERRFPDKTVLKLTCQGEIGTNPKKVQGYF